MPGVERARGVHECGEQQLGITRDTVQGRASSGIPSRAHQTVGQEGAVEQQLSGFLAQALCQELFPRSTSPTQRGGEILIPAPSPIQEDSEHYRSLFLQFKGLVPCAQQGSRARQA